MLWACILFPQLAMDAALRGRADAASPLALLAGPPQKRVLQAVNPAARRLGLKPGQSLTAARALSREFTCAEYDLTAVGHCQDLLAAWGYGFSSQVSQHYPRALLLEVHSSLALFGPWPRLEARLRAELAELGFRHRISAAPNPAAARVLSNAGDGLAVLDSHELPGILGRLPLERAGLPRELVTSLSRMGLRNLRQLLELPRDALAKRFPADLLRHLDSLLGLRPMALEFYRPADRFEARIELNFDVESHQALLFPLRRLTADLAAYLAGRDSGVQRFELHLEHHGRADTCLPVGLLSAERDPAMLFELTRGRLEQLQLPAAVHAVRLLASELPTFAPAHRQLFNERPQQALPWEQLRERLRARLGDEAVHGLSALAEHRPEQAWQPRESAKPIALPPCGPRPGWLLTEPRPLRESMPRILAGPERIESGWWDGADLRRDYYLVETRSGQRAWVYRPVGSEGPLLLHGWFA
ncbi:Y-family DNA polymerase [Pseudomonas panipatensis]|uniref:Protein ImuB n=1 Tax=Pseudomonas panipatensis TaxID=428992 RepID=A0A1G8I6N4_9PSED|nr:DNA polymerase Y family protein [Pseudomonas panipatensis]SDI14616.1 protein ImuB [Pseudomonas panipatensis]SMP75921.1 protein ImuB [Pseudomonas panipatensis]